MKKIAFLFSKSPYGSSECRELLDVSLSVSMVIKISLFFIGDGIFQILKKQNPKKIFCYNYSKSFLIFEHYKISNIYVCKSSLKSRGIKYNEKFIIYSKVLEEISFRNKLNLFKIVINC
ncbi:sulfurtransferase complex subunit TusC [Buchnera aphidicola]|uniref:sulfurtransferase complex subunit TusC n=1 Tax=Buchnera aphidicola TaxID=9 RepID=UPI0031B8A9E7